MRECAWRSGRKTADEKARAWSEETPTRRYKRSASAEKRRDAKRKERNRARWRAKHLAGSWHKPITEEQEADWVLRLNSNCEKKPPWKRGSLFQGGYAQPNPLVDLLKGEEELATAKRGRWS